MLIKWKSENVTNIQDKNIRVLKVIKSRYYKQTDG